jgi:hypothetical protein
MRLGLAFDFLLIVLFLLFGQGEEISYPADSLVGVRGIIWVSINIRIGVIRIPNRNCASEHGEEDNQDNYRYQRPNNSFLHCNHL